MRGIEGFQAARKVERGFANCRTTAFARNVEWIAGPADNAEAGLAGPSRDVVEGEGG